MDYLGIDMFNASTEYVLEIPKMPRFNPYKHNYILELFVIFCQNAAKMARVSLYDLLTEFFHYFMKEKEE